VWLRPRCTRCRIAEWSVLSARVRLQYVAQTTPAHRTGGPQPSSMRWRTPVQRFRTHLATLERPTLRSIDALSRQAAGVPGLTPCCLSVFRALGARSQQASRPFTGIRQHQVGIRSYLVPWLAHRKSLFKDNCQDSAAGCDISCRPLLESGGNRYFYQAEKKKRTTR